MYQGIKAKTARAFAGATCHAIAATNYLDLDTQYSYTLTMPALNLVVKTDMYGGKSVYLNEQLVPELSNDVLAAIIYNAMIAAGFGIWFATRSRLDDMVQRLRSLYAHAEQTANVNRFRERNELWNTDPDAAYQRFARDLDTISGPQAPTTTGQRKPPVRSNLRLVK